MKTLLATVAAGALMGTAALAQDAADENAIYSVSEGDTYASNLLGSRLYTTESDVGDEVDYAAVSADWEDVGEINDFVVGEDGSVQAVIVGVGGFLGIGEKDVAISWDDVSQTYDEAGGRFLVVSMSEDALENAPAFEYEELDNDVAETDATNPDAAAEPADTQMAEADAADPAATETDDEMAETDAADPAAAETDDQMAEADAADPAAADQAESDMAEADVTEESEAATDVAQAEATDEAAPVEGQDMAATDAPTQIDYQPVEVGQLTSEELEGATVRSASDEEWVGEIASLVLDDEGKITQAVIDVGGFLGIGEKPVAMNFDDLDIFRQGEAGPLEVTVNASREELEGMEKFDG